MGAAAAQPGSPGRVPQAGRVGPDPLLANDDFPDLLGSDDPQ